MNEENLHIIPQGFKEYPQPDVPVGDAWRDMESMLDNELPSAPKDRNSNNKGGGNSFWQSLLISVGVVGIVTLGIVLLKNKHDNTLPANNQVELIQPSDSSNILDQNTLPADSINLNDETKKDSAWANNNKTLSGDNELKGNLSDGKTTESTTSEQVIKQKKPSIASAIFNDKSLNKNEIEKKQHSDKAENIIPVKAIQAEATETGIINKPVTSDSMDKSLANPGSVSGRLPEPGKPVEPVKTEDLKKPLPEPEKAYEKVSKTTNEKSNNIAITTDEKKEINFPEKSSSGSSPEGSADKGKKAGNSFFNTVSFGTQWDIAVPLYATDYYSDNYMGKKTPYMFLIPGVWGSKKMDRHEIILRAFPYRQFNTGTHLLKSIVVQDSLNPDSTNMASTIYQTNLLKSFGFTTGLQYNFELTPSLVLGFGVDLNILNKALQQNKAFDEVNGRLLSDSLYGVKKSSSGWQYYNPVFVTGNFEIAWRRKKFDTGASVQLPLTNISSIPGKSIMPVFGQVFFRWRIK